MQTVILALATFIFSASSNAQADTLLIETLRGRQSFKEAQFRFDEAQGRSWIQIRYRERKPVPPNYVSWPKDYLVRANIHGLWYDAPSARILFNGQSGKAVCATVTEKQGHFGKKWIITPTKECRTYAVKGTSGTQIYFESK